MRKREIKKSMLDSVNIDFWMSLRRKNLGLFQAERETSESLQWKLNVNSIKEFRFSNVMTD